jgi:hypothetical protein
MICIVYSFSSSLIFRMTSVLLRYVGSTSRHVLDNTPSNIPTVIYLETVSVLSHIAFAQAYFHAIQDQKREMHKSEGDYKERPLVAELLSDGGHNISDIRGTKTKHFPQSGNRIQHMECGILTHFLQHRRAIPRIFDNKISINSLLAKINRSRRNKCLLLFILTPGKFSSARFSMKVVAKPDGAEEDHVTYFSPNQYRCCPVRGLTSDMCM